MTEKEETKMTRRDRIFMESRGNEIGIYLGGFDEGSDIVYVGILHEVSGRWIKVYMNEEKGFRYFNIDKILYFMIPPNNALQEDGKEVIEVRHSVDDGRNRNAYR